MLISDLEHLASVSQTSTISGGVSKSVSFSLNNGVFSLNVDGNNILEKPLADVAREGINFSVGDSVGLQVSSNYSSSSVRSSYTSGSALAKGFSIELKSSASSF